MTDRRGPADLVESVVLLLGVALIVALLGIIALAVIGRPIPDVLPGVALAIVTGVIGLLAPNRRRTD